MAGIKIIDAKVVGLCSNCRKDGDEIPKYTDGRIIEDGFISCVSGALGDGNCTKDDEVKKNG